MCALNRLDRWLARRLLMSCHSSTIGPPQPFLGWILVTLYPLGAWCPPIYPRAWGLMLETLSIRMRIRTTPILLLWHPISFLAPVRPGVVICMTLTVYMVPHTVGPSTPLAKGRGFLTASVMSFSLVDLSWTLFRILDLADPPPYTGRPYTGVS